MIHDQDNFNLLSELLNLQPDSVVWFKPLFSKNTLSEPIDFKPAYVNKAASKILSATPAEIMDGTLNTSDLMDISSREQIFKQCLHVWNTGSPMEFTYFSTGFKKYFNVQRSKVSKGILSITRDRTEEVIAEKEKNHQADLLNSIISNSPYGIVLYESMRNESGEIIDFKPSIRNQKSGEFAGFNNEDIETKTVKQLLSERGNYEFYDIAFSCVESGIPKNFEYYSKYLGRWIFFSMIKFRDGVLVNNIDITDRKNNEKIIENQNNELQSILDASINAVFACEAVRDENDVIYDLIITKINKAYALSNGGVDPADIEGKRFSLIYPETKRFGLLKHYCNVIQTGKSFRSEIEFKGDGANGWFDISAVKNGKNGVVVTFTDITVKKNALKEIYQKNDLLDKILKHSPSGISISQVIRDKDGKISDSRTILANEAAAMHLGIPLNIQLSKTSLEIEPAIMDSPLFQLSLKTLKTSKSFHTQYFLEATKRWLEISIAKIDEEHLISVFDDITIAKMAQIEIETSANKLNTLINTSQAGFFMGAPVYDKDGEIIDFTFTLANKVFAGFVNQQPQDLIGQLGGDWFVAYKSNGLFDCFKKTYLSDSKMQFDFHYKGESIDVWANIMITRLDNELLGSFTDFTHVKTLQLQLEKLVEDLRTSNSNLEDFAYAASHDLQEPLRKVDIFIDKIMLDLEGNITDYNQKNFDKIKMSVSRMRNLITGLLSYSKVNIEKIAFQRVDLNNLVTNLVAELDEQLVELSATVTIENLPVISGDERQLRQMFQNLVGNALKYRKDNTPPQIKIIGEQLKSLDGLSDISLDQSQQYYKIDVIDNGIGFDQKNAERIFQVFQRLHSKSEYEGTGVGLAIVQKVIKNHNGFIIAKGALGYGATFTMIIPA